METNQLPVVLSRNSISNFLKCSQSPRHAGELWLEGRLGNLLNGITLLQINLGQRTTALQIGDKS